MADRPRSTATAPPSTASPSTTAVATVPSPAGEPPGHRQARSEQPWPAAMVPNRPAAPVAVSSAILSVTGDAISTAPLHRRSTMASHRRTPVSHPPVSAHQADGHGFTPMADASRCLPLLAATAAPPPTAASPPPSIGEPR